MRSAARFWAQDFRLKISQAHKGRCVTAHPTFPTMDTEDFFAWATELVESDAKERAFAAADLSRLDPFPDDHRARVEWALARCEGFVIGESTMSGPKRCVRDVYLALAKQGMLSSEYSFVGSCRSRLLMAIIARDCKVPICPDNVFAGLESCCEVHIAVQTYAEMMRQGHYPSKPADAARLDRLSRDISRANVF